MMRAGTGVLWIMLLVGCTSAYAQTINVYERPVREERSREYDVLHYAIEIELARATRSYAGTATITMRSLRGELASCVLDAETFTITGARSEAGEALTFRQDSGSVVVFLTEKLMYGDTVTFSLSYAANEVDVDEVRYGMGAGYDLGLSFKEPNERRSAIINTLSFPTGARHWYPCYDHPNDKATTEVIATVEESFTVLSNGELLSVRHDEERRTKTFHWRQGRPHSTYLTVLVAGEYVVVKDSLDELPISYWVYPSDEQHALRTFGATPEIIRFYEDLFKVPFPWGKYDQIAIPGIGGGAESTTATVIGESAVIDEDAEQDYPSEWLVAHEAVHQWWGDYVTMRDWSHTWMNESFATYYEYVWSRHSYGEDEGAWNMENKRRQYYREADTRYRRPIVFDRWEFPNQNFDAHTYPKGAAVLHMLRARLGNEEFDAAMRHFLKKHPYASVDTRDLLVAIQEATGRMMGPFFDQWIFSAGHPDLEVEWEWHQGTQEVILSVEQVHQQDEHVGMFSFPVRVGILTKHGYSVETVHVRGAKNVFRLASELRPVHIRFDEDNTLLARVTFTSSPQEIISKMSNADVVGRRKAIEASAEHLNEEGIVETLLRTGANDPFWRVRALAVRTLAQHQKGNVEYFTERSRDERSGVRAAAVSGIGAVGSTADIGFLRDLFDRESSYAVRAEIIRALGLVDGPGQRPFIDAARSVRSHRNVIAGAAEEVLRHIDRERSQ